MTTEISGVEELLEQLDSSKLFGDLEWEIVDNSVRKSPTAKYLDDPVTRALKEDKTVQVKGNVRADRYRRWASANDLNLTVRHPTPEITLLWIEKEEQQEESE